MLSRGHAAAASPLNTRKHACLGLVLARGFNWLFRLAAFLHRLLSVSAVLGLSMLAVLEQVPNVVSHVICQHGRVSRLRALQCTAWRAETGVPNWIPAKLQDSTHAIK